MSQLNRKKKFWLFPKSKKVWNDENIFLRLYEIPVNEFPDKFMLMFSWLFVPKSSKGYKVSELVMFEILLFCKLRFFTFGNQQKVHHFNSCIWLSWRDKISRLLSQLNALDQMLNVLPFCHCKYSHVRLVNVEKLRVIELM